MGVTRIWESPRVTLPYSEEQWQAVLALGDRVGVLDNGRLSFADLERPAPRR